MSIDKEEFIRDMNERQAEGMKIRRLKITADGRLATHGIEGRPLSDSQAMAVVIQNFADAIEGLTAKIGEVARSMSK